MLVLFLNPNLAVGLTAKQITSLYSLFVISPNRTVGTTIQRTGVPHQIYLASKNLLLNLF
jgi:hypothetical protein